MSPLARACPAPSPARSRGSSALGAGIAALALLAPVWGASPAWAQNSASYFSALAASGSTQLQAPRFLAVAAALPDGEVLVAGGQDNSGVGLKSAELFNPWTKTFVALPASGATQLQTARGGAISASLPDGQVLIAGGYDNSGNELQSAELFNPATNSFSALPAAGGTQLPAPLYLGAAAALPSGQVLIAGGQNAGGSAYGRECCSTRTRILSRHCRPPETLSSLMRAKERSRRPCPTAKCSSRVASAMAVGRS